ncbi:MAG: TlpA family protein disulfide reductase [Gammaproteobacteria bacterium]|nr:TlpA family protein disulfide reductase [Gammaproteobacteria bacterium]
MLDGTTATLEQFRGRGKWLVVKIWASNCHVCNETAHEMVSLSNHRGHDMQIVGIAVDANGNRPGVLAFIERHALNYPVLFDDGQGTAYIYRRDVQQDWGGWTPTYLIYSPQGDLVARNIGAVAESDVVQFVDSYPPESRPGS